MPFKILVKFPTRGRWDKFVQVFDKYTKYASDNENIHYYITADLDDKDFNHRVGAMITNKAPNITITRGTSTGKIHACNRDMINSGDWDIVVLASDDMIPQKMGWDKRLREDMEKYYPDTDGVLWYNDGYVGQKLNTMCIMGRKYFDRFAYIYHPDYISLFCDNEFMDVSMILNKVKYSEDVLFKHEHPANNGKGMDNLYMMNEKYYQIDKITYEKRKQHNFYLDGILTK
jgi:hypothetical protein